MDSKKIRIKSIIKSQGDIDKTSSVWDCKIKTKGDVVSIFYKEKLDDDTFVNTKINVEENKVTIIRTGDYSSRMEYIKNTETEFLYNTPYGSMNAKIKTGDISASVDEQGGHIEFSYEMSFFEALSMNSIIIDVF